MTQQYKVTREIGNHVYPYAVWSTRIQNYVSPPFRTRWEAESFKHELAVSAVRRCWCGGEDGEHEADAHAEEGRW